VLRGSSLFAFVIFVCFVIFALMGRRHVSAALRTTVFDDLAWALRLRASWSPGSLLPDHRGTARGAGPARIRYGCTSVPDMRRSRCGRPEPTRAPYAHAKTSPTIRRAGLALFVWRHRIVLQSGDSCLPRSGIPRAAAGPQTHRSYANRVTSPRSVPTVGNAKIRCRSNVVQADRTERRGRAKSRNALASDPANCAPMGNARTRITFLLQSCPRGMAITRARSRGARGAPVLRGGDRRLARRSSDD
jgi:hypothetical protein